MSRRTRYEAAEIRRQCAVNKARPADEQLATSYDIMRRANRAQNATVDNGFPAPGQWVQVRADERHAPRVIRSVTWLGTPDKPAGCKVLTVAMASGQPLVGTVEEFDRHELRLLVDPAGREYERCDLFASDRATGRK